MKKLFLVLCVIFTVLALFAAPKQKNNGSQKTKSSKVQTQTGNLQWSKVAPKVLDLNDAISYCKNLNEAGHSDWKLPNIDELRSLIIDSEYTEIGGKCKISEIAGQLSSDLVGLHDSICRGNSGDNNSKLGDTGTFLSSSTVTETGGPWYINFRGGGISYDVAINGVYAGFNVRCVRKQ